jgi:8-oxo-dGTP pyrophosphatase MutT (NUDIX family)
MHTTDPLKTDDDKTDIGRFMLAIGAVVKHPTEPKILVLKRADAYQRDEWEIVYGRIAQHEELTAALQREVHEETGLTIRAIEKPISCWHIYRGKKHAASECFGITFVCQAAGAAVIIDPQEHSSFRWVDTQTALSLLKVPGIRRDVEVFASATASFQIFSSKDEKLL